MLTARGEEIDRVLGFELGAADYVVKPFSPRELAARVRAILRRVSTVPLPPGKAGTVLPLPIAHGEGRFTSARRGLVARLAVNGQAPLRYCDASGADAVSFPDNPNGAEAGVAAVCNAAGNVLAMMPHPERVLDLEDVGAADARLVLDLVDQLRGVGQAEGAAVALERVGDAEDAIDRLAVRGVLLELEEVLFQLEQAFVRLFGWTREEAIGRTSLDLGKWATPEARVAWAAARAAAARRPKPGAV